MEIRTNQSLPPTVLTTLRESFGFSGLREGQAEAISAVLAGRHVLAVMPTGSGKSLCYQLPALVLGGLTVVVSPLVALMRDQVAALRLNGIAAATINSDISRQENVAVWHRVAAGEIRLLYLSPERLMTPRMLAALERLDLKLIAIDEAHCISQWGPAFRPEYEALTGLGARYPGIPMIGLTATADPTTRDDILAKMFGGEADLIATGFDRPNLTLAVEPKQGWKRQVADFVGARKGKPGIVYCLSRRKTEAVAAMLREAGHDAHAFHAGMESAEKERVQNRFMTEPGVVVVATIAFGMGIDKPDIRFVLHADLPAGPEAYYQEIGRAGRDGAPAETLLLYGLDDLRMRRAFIAEEDGTEERQRRENKRLDALVAYCEAAECRRRTLLRYFGEESAPCGNCDACLDPVATEDGTEAAQLALAAMRGTGNRFGMAHVVHVLRGADNEKTRKFGHERLPVFARGAERSDREWRAILRQMVAAGLIGIDIAGHGGLHPTAAGEALLAGEGEFRYRPDRKREKGRKLAKAAEAAGLDREGEGLLDRLKSLRLDLAKERGVPAYVVFSDRSLIDMAARRPSDAAAFAEVYGVGAAKQRDFSEIFLAAIAEAEAA
ncbi:MAG: DNA helicase RecQ [Rhodospirillaceae bacterium]|nr:DNA helicase RecQ [Rhodospirillaceae bacterium]